MLDSPSKFKKTVSEHVERMRGSTYHTSHRQFGNRWSRWKSLDGAQWEKGLHRYVGRQAQKTRDWMRETSHRKYVDRKREWRIKNNDIRRNQIGSEPWKFSSILKKVSFSRINGLEERLRIVFYSCFLQLVGIWWYKLEKDANFTSRFEIFEIWSPMMVRSISGRKHVYIYTVCLTCYLPLSKFTLLRNGRIPLPSHHQIYVKLEHMVNSYFTIFKFFCSFQLVVRPSNFSNTNV